MSHSITIKKVQELCENRKLNLTPSRTKIMSALIDQKKPKTAYEILERIHKKDSSAKPATIYRALDFLCSNGFAHRIETDNTYIACDGEESPHVAQFLICLECKKAIEFHSHKATTEISKRANQEGFKITEEILEAKGFCQNCQ
ncbi:MAG: Fur family transcriptional regulator [SAR86 cluster bacterium]|nr:Fur family transcriptional regulator [SAR86 cluster bacterium]